MTTIQAQIPEKFTGIIQLAIEPENPSYSELSNIQDKISMMDNRWKPVEKLHCTLLHQSYPKKAVTSSGVKGDKALKDLYASPNRPTGPVTLQTGGLFHCQDLETGRESIGIWITGSEPEAKRREILELAGINYDELVQQFDSNEANRTFHISLANLTGNGGDSPAYPSSKNTSPISLR